MMHRYTILFAARVVIFARYELNYQARSPTGVLSGSMPLPLPLLLLLLLPPCEAGEDLDGDEDADEGAPRGRGIRDCADFLEDEGDTAGDGAGDGEGVRGACGGGGGCESIRALSFDF